MVQIQGFNMIQEFNELPWYDTELKEIIIDRGPKDNIKILVCWPDTHQTQCIEFLDCYAFSSDMHFGIVPPDFILEAKCILESKKLTELKELWLKMGGDLADLKCFNIITNSTNSTLNIYSLGYRIEDVKDE